MDERNHWSSFVAGLLIGAGAALLLAPQTGAQLRRRLRRHATGVRADLEDLAEKGQAAWDTAIERGQDYAERGAEVVRDTAKSARQFAEDATHRVKEAARARA